MKHIKQYENFDIVEWKDKDLDQCFEILSQLLEDAEELLLTYGQNEKNLDPEGAVILLRRIKTESALELANDIDKILDLIAEFDVESEIEKSKLN